VQYDEEQDDDIAQRLTLSEEEILAINNGGWEVADWRKIKL